MMFRKKNTYRVYFECSNCLNEVHIDIPKGTLAIGYKFDCPKCAISIKFGEGRRSNEDKRSSK